jgi:hypothetical protein
MSISDRSKGRRKHDSLHTGIPGGTEHSQSTFPSGQDQFILMFRETGGEGRRHMENILAPGDRCRPTHIVFKISNNE